jgi:hypothetical protein
LDIGSEGKTGILKVNPFLFTISDRRFLYINRIDVCDILMVNKILQSDFTFSRLVVIAVVCLTGFSVHAESWTAITSEKELKALYSDVSHEGALTGKATWTAEYCKDGSGTERAWGVSFPRAWKVTDRNTVCITSAADGLGMNI